ncbi:hypothetical protein QBC46DRAFT_375162 [Diplogelasinospora grovesii]|uniref:DUF4604 domain-containing protein n=1 Tax=Diplogelasinospora grovesii TaxID=303347 RepID=A0AAN6NEP9_9PEZI|nr:hypothetical protein QBC46DRAFT_375162 [Diplogelasinospora grovesii]
MSQKITSKNLQYTTTLPPFLARLRGEASPDSDAPDPILAARRRPGKPRSASAEAEDVPVVVDENGNVVDGLQVGTDGSVQQRVAEHKNEQDNRSGEQAQVVEDTDGNPLLISSTREKQHKMTEKVANIGGARKRKVGKVISGTDHQEDVIAEADEGRLGRKDNDYKRADVKDSATSKAKPTSNNNGHTSTKKKAKKIKLSFGDDEG